MPRLPLLIILFFITTPLLANPPWCVSGKLNQAEQFICEEPLLWEVDKQLRKTFSQVSKSLDRNEQTQWLKQRNSQCIHSVEDCLQVYKARIFTLKSHGKQTNSGSKPPWCSNKLNKVEKLICKTPFLGEADNQMRKIFYQLIGKLSSDKKASLEKEQRKWLKQRNTLCLRSVENCLQAYEERIVELEEYSVIKNNDNEIDNIQVKSYQTIATWEFNRLVSRAASKGEIWVKDALQVALKFLNQFQHCFSQQTIVWKKNNAESPTESTIIVTRDGYLDDSIRGEKYQLQLEKDATKEGNWQLNWAEKAWRCYRGHNEFSTEACK